MIQVKMYSLLTIDDIYFSISTTPSRLNKVCLLFMKNNQQVIVDFWFCSAVLFIRPVTCFSHNHLSRVSSYDWVRVSIPQKCLKAEMKILQYGTKYYKQ